MKTRISLKDSDGREISVANVELPFYPSEMDILHVAPESFKPKVKGYAKDECVPVKVWSVSYVIPREEIVINAVIR